MAVNEGNSLTIDIERVSSLIEARCGDFLLPKCCIFKIPGILYRHNEKAYVPNSVSIGPFHHGHPNLVAAQKLKNYYMRCLLSRSPIPLKDIVHSIQALETEARECYSVPISFSSDEFVQLLVVDGCFIIELLLRHGLAVEDDPVDIEAHMGQFPWHDLILVENQIPWVVLERIFDMTKNSSHDKPLIELAIASMGKMLSYRLPCIPNPSRIHHPIQDVKHIVDLLRKLLVSLTPREEEEDLRWKFMPSASRLVKAGIKFKRGSSDCIFDIRFDDGVLEIPQVVIHETTETIFRNLICNEQCRPNCMAIFASYATLLGDLIKTPTDLEILCQNEIVHNWLKVDDAVKFFNKLHTGTYVWKYSYGRLCKQVKRYCRRNRSKCHSVLHYLNTPSVRWEYFTLGAAAMFWGNRWELLPAEAEEFVKLESANDSREAS